jgi:hypothetical protein
MADSRPRFEQDASPKWVSLVAGVSAHSIAYIVNKRVLCGCEISSVTLREEGILFLLCRSMVYLTTLSVAQTRTYTVPNGRMIMNWKGYGRKRSWRNLRYYLGICLEGLKKNTKHMPGEPISGPIVFEPGTSRIRTRSVNRSAATFSRRTQTGAVWKHLCWGDYLNQRGMKWQEDGENFIVMICTDHQILLRWSNQWGWDGLDSLCRMHGGNDKCVQNFVKFEGTSPLARLGADGRMILRWILRESVGRCALDSSGSG